MNWRHPTPTPDYQRVIDEQDFREEALTRLTRIESKLSRLMQVLGYDTHGRPLEETEDDRNP